MSGTDEVRLGIRSNHPTSTGAYIDIFLSPQISFASNFNPNTDCRFSASMGTAICSVTKTPNYVYLSITPTASYSLSNPNAFPQYSYIWIYLYNIRFPKVSSAKYPYQLYIRLYNSSAANPTTYIQGVSFNVVPKINSLSNILLTEHGNVNTSSTLNFPAFVRFESKNPAGFNYVLQ